MTEVFLSQLKEVASSGDEKSFTDIIAFAKASDDISLESNLTEQGSTILMTLAAMGRHDLIEVLLKEPASCCPAVDQANNNETTALVFACSMGNVSCVRVLCEAGANVNWAIGSKDTPVMVAAAEGFDDIVSYLCTTRAADLEKTNETGQTALLCACDQGHLSTASLLLDCGAFLEAADNCQATALVIACANGFVDIARLLLQRGAITTCISEAIVTAKCDQEQSGAGTVTATKAALVALLSSYGWVPALDLQRSCQQNDDTNVKRLLTMYPQLSAGVYVRPAEAGGGGESAAQAVVFGGGASPLMVACLRNALKVVQLLVTEYPAEHNAAGEGEGDDLIDGCSLLKAQSSDGRTCMFYAAWSGALSVLKYLVLVPLTCQHQHQHQQLDLNARNTQGRSALYYACHNGHVECVAFLLASGAEKDDILPSDITEMPMRYSAFQAQNKTANVVTSSEKSSSSSSDPPTPPSVASTVDTEDTAASISAMNTVSDTDADGNTNNKAGHDENENHNNEDKDGDGEEAAAIEKVRASIYALIFGK